ncbi:hypothetical protein ACW5WQ_04945 [Aeromonas rivuli]|uniref:hypothetical protein n=1 Tax=Aeromonas rivuli TaxID=648794 RepID=UPI0006940F9C|nr:hypothetical protein [Aeromonas rivuli]
MSLLIAFMLLFSTLRVDGHVVAAPQETSLSQSAFHGASTPEEGAVKFIGTHQSHLQRLEHSLRNHGDRQDRDYQLIHDWSAAVSLLLLGGLLLCLPLLYQKHSFRDKFRGIHRRWLSRRHLQYRFSQSAVHG